MAQAHEGRQRRNGALRSHAKHVREDMNTLRKEFSQLRTDLSTLVAAQWSDMRERADDSTEYVREEVRAHPAAAIGIAAGAGLLAGWAISALNNGHSRRH